MSDTRTVGARLPAWLNGRTIAILTVILAVGAMFQTSVGNLRTELRTDIGELRMDVRKLDERVRSSEVRLATIEALLPLIQVAVAAPPTNPPPHTGNGKPPGSGGR